MKCLRPLEGLPVLELRISGSSWKPFRGAVREVLQLPASIAEIHERPRDPKSDRNIKSGGPFRPGGLLGASGFTVLVCGTSDGSIEIAVPTIDVELVQSVLSSSQRG